MATLTIRDLDEDVKSRLRVQAARNGRSMEAEARAILADATHAAQGADVGIGTLMRRIVVEGGEFSETR
ncbi:MAG: TraY domain-containing protein [Nakamurella sp.]